MMRGYRSTLTVEYIHMHSKHTAMHIFCISAYKLYNTYIYKAAINAF